MNKEQYINKLLALGWKELVKVDKRCYGAEHIDIRVLIKSGKYTVVYRESPKEKYKYVTLRTSDMDLEENGCALFSISRLDDRRAYKITFLSKEKSAFISKINSTLYWVYLNCNFIFKDGYSELIETRYKDGQFRYSQGMALGCDNICRNTPMRRTKLQEKYIDSYRKEESNCLKSIVINPNRKIYYKIGNMISEDKDHLTPMPTYQMMAVNFKQEIAIIKHLRKDNTVSYAYYKLIRTDIEPYKEYLSSVGIHRMIELED